MLCERYLWQEHSLSSFQEEFEKLTEVEGTETSPVGYLEGIFILEAYRHHGYARELLQSCEKCSKEKHCTEFASDCELENRDSLNFHLAMGFQEANRIICFLKKL